MSHSRPDRHRLAAAARALSAPLAHPTRELWYRDVMRHVRELCDADGAAVAVPDGRRTRYFTDDLPEFAARTAQWIEHRAGLMTSRDVEIDRGFQVIRRAVSVGYTSAAIDRAIGGGLRRSAFWSEVCTPTGCKSTSGLAVRTPAGEVNLVAVHERELFEPFGAATADTLTLLAPAFAAGLDAIDRLKTTFATLTTMLDHMADGMLVRDLADGHELHRNRALVRLLDADPERARIAATMSELGRAIRGLEDSRRVLEPVAPPAREIVTARATYWAWATLLPPTTFTREAAVLVAVQRVTPELPAPETLVRRYSLTPREAEVALRLARGESELVVALALAISPHTVRHHTERIFDKLGVHSRKALALRLLGAPGRPH